jgi:Domain of Unknown Function (DUF1206)
MGAADQLSRSAREAAQHPVHRARRDARGGRGWYAVAARVGLVAKGVSYGIVGGVAIALAVGIGGKATDRSGALELLAENGFGKALLVALAAGFAAYALWRFVQAVADREDDDGATGLAKRLGKAAGYVGRGLIYAGLTLSTIRLLFGADEEPQNQQAKETTAGVFDWPAGRWLVGIAGLAILGAGAWNLYRGVSTKFEDKWETGRMNRAERRWGVRAGVVGHLARAVVFGLIGLFLARAALEFDPKEAIGLDGALQTLARTSYGPFLLGLTAAGLIAYGLYCLVDARYRDVSVD